MSTRNDKPIMPEWMPSQFAPESEMSDYARKRKRVRLNRLQDDYVQRDFTLGETVANAVSQGVATALAIAALVILVIMAQLHGGGIHLVAALMFAVPMIIAFLMSTLYHALQGDTARRVFKVLDNSSTFLLIAGVVSPYLLLVVGGSFGTTLCVVEWGLAIAGVLVEALWATRPRWVHGVGYAIMAVVFLFTMPTLMTALPPAGFWLFVAGGICFFVAVLLRWFSNVLYLRFVFHLVVVAGCVCLFLSVALFVV